MRLLYRGTCQKHQLHISKSHSTKQYLAFRRMYVSTLFVISNWYNTLEYKLFSKNTKIDITLTSIIISLEICPKEIGKCLKTKLFDIH